MNARLLPLADDPAPYGPPLAAGFATPLPPGAALQEFRIVEVVGQGGFGIVYRAEDGALGRTVALKEYVPAQLAARGADGGLGPASPAHAATYAAGLAGFLEEARMLARFRHPGLVEVIRCWEQNGTAYIAMPLYEGLTLERLIAAHPGGLGADALRAIVAPLLGALATLHAGGGVHRDVAPDTVIVRLDGGAVLLDLGAARRVIGDRVRATTVMLKGGYAPFEQYADDPDCRIGPWSDVYALAAVMHHAIVGEAPPAAPLRAMRDARVPLAARRPAGWSEQALEAIDAALSVRPEARPRTAAAFAEALGLGPAAAVLVPPGSTGARPAAARAADGGRRAWLGFAGAAALAAVVALAWTRGAPPADVEPEPVPPPADARGAASGPTGPGPESGSRGRVASVAAGESPGTSPPARAADPQAAPRAAPRTGTMRLVVSPWAEVWIDGVRRGVTPPTLTLALAPGRHRVELRNPGAAPVVREVEVGAGRTAELVHRFEAERAR